MQRLAMRGVDAQEGAPPASRKNQRTAGSGGSKSGRMAQWEA